MPALKDAITFFAATGTESLPALKVAYTASSPTIWPVACVLGVVFVASWTMCFVFARCALFPPTLRINLVTMRRPVFSALLLIVVGLAFVQAFTVSADAHSMADVTTTSPAHQHQVLALERVSALAMGLSRITSSEVVTAQNIDAHRHYFQMFWIDTTDRATQMVNCQIVRNRAEVVLVNPSCAAACVVMLVRKDGIPVLVNACGPHVTSTGRVDGYLFRESINGRSRYSASRHGRNILSHMVRDNA